MSRFNDLKHRFIAVNLFVLLLCFSLLIVGSYFFFKHYVFTSIRQNFLEQANVIAEDIWPNLTPQQQISYLKRWQQKHPDKKLYWLHKQQWLPQNIAEPKLAEIASNLLPLAFNGQAVVDNYFHGEMVALVPVNQGVLALTILRLHPFPKYFSGFIVLLIFSFVGVTIVCLYPSVNKIIKVIQQLQRLAASVAQGHFGKTIDVNRTDEIGELANSFNHMSQQLAETEQQNHNLIAAVSHELRSPLARIRVNAEQILLTPDTIDSQANCETICHEVDQLDAMVSDLLQAAKMHIEPMTLQLTTSDVSELLSQLIQRYQPMAKANGVELRYVTTLSSLLLPIDPQRLSQAITNLIDNAITAVPANGFIKVSLSQTDQEAMIEIQDNGPGIDPAYQKLIFERFYRVDASRDRKTGGVGLGLTLVKQIIQAHYGTIELASQPGKGSTFCIQLPIQ